MSDRESYCVIVKLFGGSISCSHDDPGFEFLNNKEAKPSYRECYCVQVKLLGSVSYSHDDFGFEFLYEYETQKETVRNPSLDISDVMKLVTGVQQTQFNNSSGQLKAEQSELITKDLF